MVKSFIICFSIAFLLVIAIIGCSGNSVSPDSKVQANKISGTYFLHGTQVNLRFCWPQDCGTTVMDTISTSFTVTIQKLVEKTDTLRFSGLEGADASLRHIHYWGSTSSPLCVFGEERYYCADALYRNQQLEFNLVSPFGRYFGEGTLKNGEIQLETHFRHRGSGADYSLQGFKIDGI
jgi:hypothetical protein